MPDVMLDLESLSVRPHAVILVIGAIKFNRSGSWSEQVDEKGLWPAIEEFLEANSNWELHERFTNNNGLTILKRK